MEQPIVRLSQYSVSRNYALKASQLQSELLPVPQYPGNEYHDSVQLIHYFLPWTQLWSVLCEYSMLMLKSNKNKQHPERKEGKSLQNPTS